MKKFIKKNLLALITLAVGAYIFGFSFQMLSFFFPLIQLVIISLAIGIFVLAVTNPKLLVEEITKFLTEEKGGEKNVSEK